MTPSSPPSTPPDTTLLGPLLFVGHRASGKTTLGRALASALDRPFVDLDQRIAATTGREIARWVRDDLEGFRRVESDLLAALCAGPFPVGQAPVIAAGGGTPAFPPEAFVVWLRRENWRESCRGSDRPRVRPELEEEAEWQWMEETREPRWRDAAHLELSIPRARSVADALLELSTLLRWAARVRESPLAHGTALVPTRPGDLPRALRDARRLGLGGVELRSDVFSAAPAISDAERQGLAILASLRHDDPTWLEGFADADAWDLDITRAKDLLPDSLRDGPSRRILSAHPERLSPALIAEARALAETHGFTEIKLAPRLDTLAAIGEALELAPALRSLPYPTTLLATGRRSRWLRPVFAPKNARNYLPIGISSRDPDHPSPLDLQRALPFLGGPLPDRFDALLGDPVDGSKGDWWHRLASLEEGDVHRSYLKIPVPRGAAPEALELLKSLPIRGLSITSPLKQEVAESPLNTLRRRVAPDGTIDWQGTDTDEAGMLATLEDLEACGEGPGATILFGRGGVSPAVLRALHRRGWPVVAHLSARAGWQEAHRDLGPVVLIINAAGPLEIPWEFLPDHRVWLDLHYNDVRPGPPGSLHLQGDRFFAGQAAAQRAFWSSSEDHQK